ncbi:MAG: aldo/keto reductase [Pseudonocardiales bacterium]|nr:MAG: aldo/keto reductase [Pseudonocardiales bacterium]
MKQRTIGDTPVGAIGLGLMPLSQAGRPPGRDEDRERVHVATKGGHVRTADGGWSLDGSPTHLRRACEASLGALAVDAIDLYQLHRPDPHVPWAESIGALRDLHDVGKVRHVGISNASIAQIDEARAIVPIATVQKEFSPEFRSSEPELEHCHRHGIAFVPWSPFGGGQRARDLDDRHPSSARVARRHNVSTHQVVLRWMLGCSDIVVPIPVARRPATIGDSAAAADLQLSAEDLELPRARRARAHDNRDRDAPDRPGSR